MKRLRAFKVYNTRKGKALNIQLVKDEMIDELPEISAEWMMRIAGYHDQANSLPDAPSWGGQYFMKSWRAMMRCDEICPIDTPCPC